MKKLMALLIVCVTFASTPAFSTNFEKDGWFDSAYSAATKGDYATALSEWEPLARKGNARAQYNLGVMHANGLGVPQNYGYAEQWYRFSAENRHARAMYNLGVLYHDGHARTQNTALINDLINQSGVKSGAAKFLLGTAYDSSLDGSKRRQSGVLHNYILSHMWFNLAASNGYRDGANKREFVARKITQAHIAQAQDLANKCINRNYKGC